MQKTMVDSMMDRKIVENQRVKNGRASAMMSYESSARYKYHRSCTRD
jgi:hypothetical protein